MRESPCLPLSFRWPLGLVLVGLGHCLPLAHTPCVFFLVSFFIRFIFPAWFFFSISTHALFMLLSILCTHFKGGNSIPTHSVFPKKTRKPTRNFATRKLNHSSVKFTAKLHPGLINFRFELGNLSCLNSEEDEVEREEKRRKRIRFPLFLSLFLPLHAAYTQCELNEDRNVVS